MSFFCCCDTRNKVYQTFLYSVSLLYNIPVMIGVKSSSQPLHSFTECLDSFNPNEKLKL